MNDRSSKIGSLSAINCWDYAELGAERVKKIEKQMIKRKRRTLEKRQVKQIMNELEVK